uniref:Uncharacterized protein n=1 Tax=Arundo donax TaxID=35708 RepID=A0A0A8YWX3_ARUDO
MTDCNLQSAIISEPLLWDFHFRACLDREYWDPNP